MLYPLPHSPRINVVMRLPPEYSGVVATRGPVHRKTTLNWGGVNIEARGGGGGTLLFLGCGLLKSASSAKFLESFAGKCSYILRNARVRVTRPAGTTLRPTCLIHGRAAFRASCTLTKWRPKVREIDQNLNFQPSKQNNTVQYRACVTFNMSRPVVLSSQMY